ncbi:MAG: hypothetical protein ACYTFY_10420 [Planctomycetota bacterium]|jgi:hypothetical protein
MKKLFLILILIYSTTVIAAPRLRPDNWAKPIIDTELDNFYKVSDKVYRSSQPDEDTFKDVEKVGIVKVLNLRQNHTDNNEAENTKLKLNHVSCRNQITILLLSDMFLYRL